MDSCIKTDPQKKQCKCLTVCTRVLVWSNDDDINSIYNYLKFKTPLLKNNDIH